MNALVSTAQPHFDAPYAQDDDRLIAEYAGMLRLETRQDARIDRDATHYIEAIRASSGSIGGVDDFLREYGLSTPEGLAMMVLAEALLRVPDAGTQDQLIEDKLREGNWSTQEAHGDTWFVAASAWALGMTARVIRPGETPESVLQGVIRRLGLPTVRTATKQAMRFLGHHFVLGENIADALSRAAKNETRGYRHSFDMLGEGARTAADAKRYWQSYADAIEAIGNVQKSGQLPERMGISVKLSALHPRYHATHKALIMRELVPDVLKLAQMAMKFDLNFTIDAEEADRLELSLSVIAAVFSDPSLTGWDGFGLAVQAYQKRGQKVIEYIDALCLHLGRKMMVRLVKGAYWDTEVKVAQERGLADYPVFTRKAATDVSYLACARLMLDARARIYPQFATHNALTVAMILELAGEERSGFEFQRLHGMGEPLYERLAKDANPVPCRIYAPVGGYRDLLAYLVRRLLENGANSSFVAVAGDASVPVADLLVRPLVQLGFSTGNSARHGEIAMPCDIYPDRRNSAGLEFGCNLELTTLTTGMDVAFAPVEAHPLIPDVSRFDKSIDIHAPSNSNRLVGSIAATQSDTLERAVASARNGFRKWSRTPAAERAAILRKAGDRLEENRDRFMALLANEAGKTLDDGLSEIREAVDFLRYYAVQSEQQFGQAKLMPGPTGEENRYGWRGRGVFVCISPWNFPLAIFLGQVTAALAAGNAVIAKPAGQTPLVAFEAINYCMHVAFQRMP